jgi:hypothetical protein
MLYPFLLHRQQVLSPGNQYYRLSYSKYQRGTVQAAAGGLRGGNARRLLNSRRPFSVKTQHKEENIERERSLDGGLLR